MLFSFHRNKTNKDEVVPVLSESPVRSLAKAASWRVTGSIDTILLSWLFTSDIAIAAAIGLTEVVTKMVLYYLHERVWNRLSLGKSAVASADGPLVDDRPMGKQDGLATSPNTG
ncbi:MAG: DUF2061 domain-containing protein [Candidatus Thiodiazotropha sp. (ex Dulcina madagascariensis)]|nr:DUF2061 domain-containing protein [Candidatus Thiodiazotropha sp. (ex Dulcina madagascariensis)]